MKIFVVCLILLVLTACAPTQSVRKVSLVASAAGPCTITNPAGTAYNGPVNGSLSASCPGGGPPVCTPPQVLDPTTGQCVNPTPPPGTCAATQLSSSFNGTTLTRQCSGSSSQHAGSSISNYNGQLYEMMPVAPQPLGPLTTSNACCSGPFPAFVSGKTFVINITSHNYVSLHFNAVNNGQLQFNADGSLGNAGFISVSTKPGAFTVADGVLSGQYGPCVYNNGFGNSLWMGMGGADCALVKGKDYYVNFADVDVNGVPSCFNGPPNSCASSTVSYQVLAGK